jgi:mannose-6-phosphate isomerase class I
LGILNIDLRCKKNSYSFEFSNRTIKQKAIRHHLYNVDILDVKSEANEQKKNHYHILTSVYGDFSIIIDEKEYPLSYTNTVIIPAEISSYRLKGDGRILISYQPI